jgi:hypothetical protein
MSANSFTRTVAQGRVIAAGGVRLWGKAHARTPQQRAIEARKRRAKFLREKLDRENRERRRAELATPQQRRANVAAVRKRCAKLLAGVLT